MRLTLDALIVLDAIDRRGSFAAAAQELHRVPSALTYTVQKLEDDLRVELFDRTGHRAKLTPPGRELLREGRHLLRAAGDLESRVQRVATGWEAELAIAYDATIPPAAVIALVEEFCRESCGTRLRLLAEVLGGSWDALTSARADLVIGAPGQASPSGGYTLHRLGEVEWVFTVAPHHPLAQEPEPIASSAILAHRAVTVADTSRNLAPLTSGLLSGQDTLTLPDLATKVLAQVRGLGVGNLPRYVAEREAAAGRLLIKRTEEPKVNGTLYLAWRTAHQGKALSWFVERLRRDPEWLARVIEATAA